jgi:hypothetical protein
MSHYQFHSQSTLIDDRLMYATYHQKYHLPLFSIQYFKDEHIKGLKPCNLQRQISYALCLQMEYL